MKLVRRGVPCRGLCLGRALVGVLIAGVPATAHAQTAGRQNIYRYVLDVEPPEPATTFASPSTR